MQRSVGLWYLFTKLCSEVKAVASRAVDLRLSPVGEHFYDGISLDPLEVMFVKLKSYTLMNGSKGQEKGICRI